MTSSEWYTPPSLPLAASMIPRARKGMMHRDASHELGPECHHSSLRQRRRDRHSHPRPLMNCSKNWPRATSWMRSLLSSAAAKSTDHRRRTMWSMKESNVYSARRPSHHRHSRTRAIRDIAIPKSQLLASAARFPPRRLQRRRRLRYRHRHHPRRSDAASLCPSVRTRFRDTGEWKPVEDCEDLYSYHR